MQLRLQARYSLGVVIVLAMMMGLIVTLHLMEVRSMFAATSRTYSEVLTSALFSQAKKQGEGLGRFLAAMTADHIYRLEIDRIENVVRAVGRQDGIVYVRVHDRKNSVLARAPDRDSDGAPASGSAPVADILRSRSVGTFSHGNLLHIVAPVMVGRDYIGWVGAGLSLTDVGSDIEAIRGIMGEFAAANQRRFVAVYIGVAVITVLLGFGVSLLMVRGVVRPIRELSQYTRRIGAGNYDDPPPIDRADELGDLARALEQMAMDLKQVAQVARLATLGEMAVGMAHELSQPLNTIRLAAENTLMAIEQGRADSEFEQAKLTLIARQAENMGELIKRMCVVGRSEGPQDVIDPRESVRDAHSLLAHQCEDEGIAVTLDMPENCARVLGRRNELAQVVINLISNARDAIIESAIGRRNRHAPTAGRIEISVHDVPSGSGEAAGHVLIRVKDNGGGIPPDIVERVFDPFFTTKEVTKGTGLGLSISFGIVNAMGGRITAENFGGGALFAVTLPAIEAAEN